MAISSLQRIVTFSAFVLFLLLGSASASVYIWNNSTSGDWKSERWLQDGNGPEICCPGVNDTAVVNATLSGNLQLYLINGTTVRNLYLSRGTGSSGFLYFITDGSEAPLHMTSSLDVRSGVRFVVGNDATLRLPSGSSTYFGTGSTISGFNGIVECEVDYNCTINLDGGTFTITPLRIRQHTDQIFVSLNVLGSIVSLYILPVSLGFFRTRININSPWTTQTIDNGNAHIFFDSDINVTDHNIIAYEGDFTVAGSRFSGSRLSLRARTPSGSAPQYYGRIRIRSGSIMNLEDTNLQGLGDTSIILLDQSSLRLLGNSNLTILGQSTLLLNYANFSLETQSNDIVVSDGSSVILRAESELDVVGNMKFYVNDRSVVIIGSRSHLRFSGDVLSLTNATLAIQDNSNVSIIRGVRNNNYILIQSTGLSYSRLSALQSLLGDSASTVDCANSALTTDSTFLSFSLEMKNCSLTSRGDLYIYNGTMIHEIANSTIDIQGVTYLASNSSWGFYDNSSVTISGNLQLSGAQMLLWESRLNVLGGGIHFSNCRSPPLEDVLNLRLENHTSCMLLVFSGTLKTTGDFVLPSQATVYLFESDADWGGIAHIGTGSFLATLSTRFKNIGQFFVTSGFVVFRDSQYFLDGGSLSLSLGSRGYFVRTNTTIISGYFSLSSKSSAFVSTSVINILGGDLRIESVASLDELLRSPKETPPGFYMTEMAEVNLFAGSVLLGPGNLINMQNETWIRIRGGNMTMQNSSTLVIQSKGTLLIDGGSLFVPGGIIYIRESSLINITSGDIRLSSHAGIFISRYSSIVLKGSVFIEQKSSMLLNVSSSMHVDGGSIEMDNTSILQIDGNSSISGVGAIRGKVIVLSGVIRSRNSETTNLTVVTLSQSNQSRYEVTLSSSFGSSGASTQVFATGNITLGGQLDVVIDPSMIQRLLGGEEVIIMSTMESNGLKGMFSNVSVITGAASANVSCAVKVKTTTTSLAIVFDLNLCNDPALGSTPTAIIDSLSNSTAGMIAGIIVAVIVVIVIVVVVVVFKVPQVRNKVMPWKDGRENKSSTHETELDEDPEVVGEGQQKSWKVTKPSQN